MIENSIVYRDFKGKYEYLPISKAEGSLIWDRNGKRYIDFTSGWNVTNLGWNNPEVAEALISQAKKNVQGLLWGSDPIQEEYAKALTSALPKELNACVKETGGTESVEVAIKVARVYTERKKIIGFNSHYHGQLFASLAIGYPKNSHPKLDPLVPEITPIDFPHDGISEEEFSKFLLKFDKLLSKKDVAAVVTEPGIVTGWGSTLIAYPGFLKKIREITKKYGTLLIVDEVGTGFSRTGKLFAIERESVIPDMIALAKGISNGASAIGTLVGKAEIFDKAFSEAILISTFGWTPIACAAALKTLQIHQRDKTFEMAEKKGKYIMEKLRAQIGDKVVGVRGMGMEIGVQFKSAEICKKAQMASFKDGLHVIVGSGNNMQIMPPITIPQELLDEGLDILIGHIKS
jgi:putrescine aminotransferase